MVELFGGHLRRLGLSVTSITHADRSAAERLNSMTGDDVILAFNVRSITKGLPTVLELASEVGALSILIGDETGTMVRPKPDMLLCASRGGSPRESLSMLVPMTIGNVLIFTLSSLDGGRTTEMLNRCDRLIHKFDDEDTSGDTLWK